VTPQGTESVRYIAEKEANVPAAAPSPVHVREPNSADRTVPDSRPSVTDNPPPPVTIAQTPKLTRRQQREMEKAARKQVAEKQVAAKQDVTKQTLATRQPAPRQTVPQQTAPEQMARLSTPELTPPTPTTAPAVSVPVPPPTMAQQQEAASQQATIRSPRPRPQPSVTISTEPVAPPKYQEWVHKVPLVRGLQKNRYKAGEGFVLARPIREGGPRVPARIARELPGNWRVNLKLNIDSFGHVRDVELMSEADERLVNIAVEAVRQWRFEPARLHDRPVSSDLIVTLHFRIPAAEDVLAQER
jgi:Gram-negative bacterial TonB protein C-terminal